MMKTPWPILTADEMRAAEAAIFASGVEDYALMQQAGRAAAEIVWRAGGHRPVLVLCGPGNNGGDGYVVARALADKGVPVRVAALCEPKTESARKAHAEWGGPVEDIFTATPAVQLVDALFGIGLTRGLDAALAQRLCELSDAAAISYALDVPSGIGTDTGELLSAVPRFDICIALGALKPAHVLRPGTQTFERLVCCDIGVDPACGHAFRLAKPKLEAPADDAHKYTRGLVAVVAGKMAGAAALSAQAAGHSGTGYVKLLGAQAIVDLPHAIVRGRIEDLDDRRIACVLVGPGLGRGEAATDTLKTALAQAHPAVVDADGLLALAEAGFDLLPERAILTPHAGEFAALFPDISGTVMEQARAAAARARAVVILKGPTTVIAAPDGRTMVADRSSSWLSTAGTGDVLAGICAARLAVGGDPFKAACEAVWLHGEAARRVGPAFLADDLIPYISQALANTL